MQSDARPLTRRVDYKIHGLTDACCRPIAFLLTGGQVADCIAADELLDGLLTAEILHGDKGYDSNASVERSRARAWSQTSHPKTIDAGRTASRRGSLGTAMRSSACSDASRTFVASQPPTTAWPLVGVSKFGVDPLFPIHMPTVPGEAHRTSSGARFHSPRRGVRRCPD